MLSFDEIDKAFEALIPDCVSAPVLFNSPHSGLNYPRDFLRRARLPLHELRRSEDCFVDALFEAAPELGMVLMRAHFPRAYLDLNREAYELDPRMFDGDLPSSANTRSSRVAAGLGSIPRIVGDHVEIYSSRLPLSEVERRINGLYRPYHALLTQALNTLHRRFGSVLLVDCHSMPSHAQAREDGQKADIVLGDRFGTSASAESVEVIESCFLSMGYRVKRNHPYAGGFITEFYGRPHDHRHAVQIEINRALYMNEQTYALTTGFSALKADLTALMVQLKSWQHEKLEHSQWAAE